MIVTLTPNPALDITWQLDGFETGHSHRVDTGLARAGGKGLNVSRVLHSQGYSTVAVTSGMQSDEFAQELAASGIPHQLVRRDSPTRRSLTFVDSTMDEATVINEVGGELTDGEMRALLDAALAAARSGSILAISGSLPPGLEVDMLGRLVTAVRELGIAVLVDTGGPGLLAAAEAGASVLKPNLLELRTATGVDDPEVAARQLIDLGAQLVVVSMGADGLAMFTAAEPRAHLVAHLPSPLHGNPTGAGDAAVAAICSVIAERIDVFGSTDAAAEAREELARRATAWSAAAVLAPQAGTLAHEVEELADQVIVTRVEEL